MKKQSSLFILILFGCIGSANAQLRVNANGYVSIQTTETPVSPFAINGKGYPDFHVSINGEKSGLHCIAEGDGMETPAYAGYFTTELSTLHNSVGIRIIAGKSSSTVSTEKTCYGLMAAANGGRRNIGVLGKISSAGYGAAVYGTTNGDYGSVFASDQHRYAGFFNGNTKVTGNLVVEGLVEGTLLGEALSSSSNALTADYTSIANRSITDCLSTISVGTYRVSEERNQRESDLYAKMDIEDFDEGMETDYQQSKENEISIQRRNKTHYALSGDDLESVFPDLVYIKEDGSKAINYIELIPLLVQSINELNTKLSAYENGRKDAQMKTTQTGIKTATASSSRLYQNTPNPFTERTEIRFNVPEDAQSAFIYIFDMTGKMLRQIPVDASMQSITINGYELSAGIYLYSLSVNGQEIDTKRMILSK